MASKPVPMKRAGGRPPKHAGRMVSRIIRQGKLDGRTWLAQLRADLMETIATESRGVKFAELPTIRKAMTEDFVDQLIEVKVRRQHRQKIILRGEVPTDDSRDFYTAVNTLWRSAEKLGIDPDVVDKAPSLAEYTARFTAADTDDTTEDVPAAGPGRAHPPTHDSADQDAPRPVGAAIVTEANTDTAPMNDAPSEAAEVHGAVKLSDPSNATNAGTPATTNEQENEHGNPERS